MGILKNICVWIKSRIQKSKLTIEFAQREGGNILNEKVVLLTPNLGIVEAKNTQMKIPYLRATLLLLFSLSNFDH